MQKHVCLQKSCSEGKKHSSMAKLGQKMMFCSQKSLSGPTKDSAFVYSSLVLPSILMWHFSPMCSSTFIVFFPPSCSLLFFEFQMTWHSHCGCCSRIQRGTYYEKDYGMFWAVSSLTHLSSFSFDRVQHAFSDPGSPSTLFHLILAVSHRRRHHTLLEIVEATVHSSYSIFLTGITSNIILLCLPSIPIHTYYLMCSILAGLILW